MSQLIPVVLSGGSGSRLWPLSRSLRPKQFLGVTEDASLFQLTLKRLQGITADAMRPIVVANNDHRFLVGEQCRCPGATEESERSDAVGHGYRAACSAGGTVDEPYVHDPGRPHLARFGVGDRRDHAGSPAEVGHALSRTRR